MQTALGLFYSDKTTYAGLVQRPQNPGPRWPHRVENSIRLGVAGVGLNGIPAVNDLPVLYEQRHTRADARYPRNEHKSSRPSR
jgi:hypothetical protein